jgi:hypothetical protein
MTERLRSHVVGMGGVPGELAIIFFAASYSPFVSVVAVSAPASCALPIAESAKAADPHLRISRRVIILVIAIPQDAVARLLPITRAWREFAKSAIDRNCGHRSRRTDAAPEQTDSNQQRTNKSLHAGPVYSLM